jgi:hypothetical protein
MVSRVDERMLGTLTMAVVTDKDGLYDHRTGAAFAPALRNFFEILTAKHTSEPFFWQFFAILQVFQGHRLESLESRFKQARASQARLWELQDTDRFTDELNELIMCFQAIDELLEDPELAAEVPKRLQPLAYSVRNAEGRLGEKLRTAVQAPEDWRSAAQTLASLAAALEARAGQLSASGACKSTEVGTSGYSS